MKYPITWEVLGCQLRVTECCTVGAMPVPDNGTSNGVFAASLAIESLPVTPPAAVGLKFTETVTD
jgi:hypothetical protein